MVCQVPRGVVAPDSDPKLARTAALSSLPSGTHPAPAPPSGIGEERFTPIVTEPAFAAVAAALEQGDAKLALVELDRAVAAHPPAEADAPRVALFTGLSAERASDAGRALAAYERADVAGYVLSGHAKVGKSRALLALGRSAEALAVARSVPEEPSLTSARRLALADAALGVGDRPAALAALRAELAASSGKSGWGVALRLAELSLAPASDGKPPEASAVLTALSLARRVAAEAAAQDETARRATDLEARALAALPPAERAEHSTPGVQDEITRVEVLLDARRFADALSVADSLAQRPGAKLDDRSFCQLESARAKALAGRRDRAGALSVASGALDRCKGDPAAHARLLFNLGRYAAAEARFTDAARYYGRVETEHPESSLADDARLAAALAYLELGVEARFTDLVQRLPDDFPEGDMVAEGLFRLAVRRMDRGDWSGAASVLERAVGVVGDGDAARGGELGGREKYFLARCELHLGQRDRALERLEEVVEDQPLSYYMLHAYSRLLALDAARAGRARKLALERAQSDGRPRVPPLLLEEPGMRRALELFRVGETASAVTELDALGLTGPGARPELLWAVARTYTRAGADKLAHDVVRARLTDWLARWPAGDWADAWRVAFPTPYRAIVEGAAARQGLDPALVFAVIREESAFDPGAESPADAHGLMQLIVPTARVAAKGTGLPHDRRALKRPKVNVELGCRTLARYLKAFSANPLLAIPGYNAGPGRVRRWVADRPSADFDLWVELIPYLETRRYTKRVLASRAAYAFLYAKPGTEPDLTLPEKVTP